MNNGSRRNPFLSGVTALTLSTLVVKVIGLVYKIPMMHYLGAEGMGYFNSAYELYSLFFVIATAGLPVAVSILISENVARGRLRNVKKIYGASFAVFLAIGLAGALLLCLFSKQFAAAVGSPDASLAIATIAPTVFFVSVAAVVRGYFQGKQNMVPTAVSQVIEALGKLILGILLAAFAVKQGWPADKTAAVAVVGLVVGTAISMLYLLLSQALKRFREDGTLTDATTEPSPKILRRLFALAIPVTVSASLSSLTRVADMTLILRRMTDIGYDATVATAMFGSYSTLAVPIYHLPSSLIAGIAVSLVPTLTEAVESRDRLRADRLIADALRLCAFVAIPCSLGLSVFSRSILSMLFFEQAEAVALTAPLLSCLGLSVFSSCLVTVTGAVLQANRRMVEPIFSMAAGIVVKLISAYILIGTPSVGMMGAPISTLLCNLAAVGMNFYYIEKHDAFRGRIFGLFMRPTLSAGAAIAVAVAVFLAVRPHFTESISFLGALACCAVVYFAAAIKLGVVGESDLALMPKGLRKCFDKGKHKNKV